ncbi:MAG TPA: NifU family protein [Thermoanaerobaculia bacterium]|nr:NifU family protein [Thermoanaerobaculia bacterium]HUM31303.1 NifU family protein [Thermoanaerobaculia bacterium]HXK69657.1 NifU family protein [Thermoanaerobaculia bacterium]
MSDDFRSRVEEVLEREIRPGIRMDGGEIDLVEAKDGIVQVRLSGACGGCPMSTLTLVHFVEERLRAAIPEIEEVQSV